MPLFISLPHRSEQRQHQKRLCLQEARRLVLAEARDASPTCYQIGDGTLPESPRFSDSL